MVATGARYGARREDIFGCLYFYLHEQLQAFATRLRQHKISFHFLETDPTDLPSIILSGQLASGGIPADTRFDRIDVNNLCDLEQVNLPRILSVWGPVLNKANPCATLVGTMREWSDHEKGASIVDEGNNFPTQINVGLMKAMSTNVTELWKRGWVCSVEIITDF